MLKREACDCANCRHRAGIEFDAIIGVSFTRSDEERLAREVISEFSDDKLAQFISTESEE